VFSETLIFIFPLEFPIAHFSAIFQLLYFFALFCKAMYALETGSKEIISPLNPKSINDSANCPVFAPISITLSIL